eukprot:jgi/Chlat1/3430/Chrsp23S03823
MRKALFLTTRSITEATRRRLYTTLLDSQIPDALTSSNAYTRALTGFPLGQTGVKSMIVQRTKPRCLRRCGLAGSSKERPRPT